MSEVSIGHRYSIVCDGCAYCGKEWRKIQTKYCMPLSAVVDQAIDRAKQIQAGYVRRALWELRL